MISTNDQLSIETRGKGTYEITAQVAKRVRAAGVRQGVATIFIQHTSASLIIFENADPSARADLATYFEKIAPENEKWMTHTLEGSDDMPSHLRMVLTRTSEQIPVVDGELALGTWQGIFIFEHRRAPQTRNVIVSVLGTPS